MDGPPSSVASQPQQVDGRSMLWRILRDDDDGGNGSTNENDHHDPEINHPTDTMATTPISPPLQNHHHRIWQARTSISHPNRRGSVQLMQEINLQQFPYPHQHQGQLGGTNSPSLALSPLAAAVSSHHHGDAGTGMMTTATSIPSAGPSQPVLNHDFMDDGTSLDAMVTTTTSSKRRVARELLPMSGMRSKRSIIDPRSISDDLFLLRNAMGNNNDDNDDDDEAYYFDGDGNGDDQEYDFNNMYQDHGDARDRTSLHRQSSSNQESTSLLENEPEWIDGRSPSYGTTATTSGKDGNANALKKSDDRSSLLLPHMNHSVSIGSTTAATSVRTTTNNNKGTIPGSTSTVRRSIISKSRSATSSSTPNWMATFIQQVSAVAIVGILNMMIAIPFGASYFPIGWKTVDEVTLSDDTTSDGTGNGVENVHGSFPLPGRQALGLRMFLFATMMGQLVLTFQSKFVNAVGLQMVENVPFLHALAYIVISRQGYGVEALSTLFFLFGVSSIIVGIVFYLLGKFQLGKVVYFFPNHVLVGCIGGIGIFILFTAVEVTTNVPFELNLNGLVGLVEHWYLLWVVLAFEVSLRLLMWATQDELGRPKFQLLTPIYYISITPIFYLGLWIAGVKMDHAREMGYFFPSTNVGDGYAAAGGPSSPWMDPHLWDIFRVVDFRTISWVAVLESTGTMIALAAFSLIHVPINIPAFAISTDVETDMNAELIAHGWSNGLSGIFGGLQNYMTYSNSVLYAKTGGKGKVSSLGIVLVTAGLFVIGPSICDYLPRCMAGTLLLHIGVDLVLEGVFDSYGQYDNLEYAGIWLITVVMTVWGMTAALIAGIIAALSTYAVQSINYHNPIRQILTASTLRSSAWARCAQARAILENDTTGRARILIFQLQGHLFFGNVAQLTDTIKDVLKEKKDEGDLPLAVIVDFTLVVGMDSSAAHAIAKLKKILHRLFHVEISIFVTGSDRGGFPCEFALSEALAPTVPAPAQSTDVSSRDHMKSRSEKQELDWNDVQAQKPSGSDHPSAKQLARGSISVSANTASILATKALALKTDGRVCESLDDALKFAEDILIAREDPTIDFSARFMDIDDWVGSGPVTINMTLEEEVYRAKKYLRELFPDDSPEELVLHGLDLIVSKMVREEYDLDAVLWEQGAESDSLKILVGGELISIIDETGASEPVGRGNVVGELGLVHGTKRLTTLICASPKAILYSLNVDSWKELKVQEPKVASLIDGIVIRYLAHRVQHVSNRYFHTTLPV